jgi:putative membrane protein
MVKSFVGILTRHRRALLFASWAATLLVLIKLDRYRAFLRPEFGVILEAAYVILLLLLVAELWRRNEAPLHGSLLLSPAILLLPILFVMNAQGVELDSYAFEKRSVGTPRVAAKETPSARSNPKAPSPPAGTSPVAPSGNAPPSSPLIASAAPSAASSGPPAAPPPPAARAPGPSAFVPVTHLDLYNSPKKYEGQWVTLVGMAYRNEEARKDFGPNVILVFRFVVACCAADAQPIAVVVDGKSGPRNIPDNSWVKVQGRFSTRRVERDDVPLIEEAVLSPTSEPKEPYLY